MHERLHLPIEGLLADARRVLVAGAGGGYDVFAGLPIDHALRALGKEVHLANYSFVRPDLAARVSPRSEVVIEDLLVGVRGPTRRPIGYFPEGHLAQWFYEQTGEERTVWLIDKTGIPAVRRAYEALVDRLEIDAVILCDAGVDSLMRGDEDGAGTYLEDTISIAAVAGLSVPVKILAAIGVGTEVEEEVCHFRMLENVAALTRRAAFHGVCALTPQTAAFQFYERVATEVFTAPGCDPSRIHSRIVPACRGVFGPHNWLDHPRQPNVFHSPLMALYWFFDVVKVHERSLVAELIADAPDFLAAARAARYGLAARKIRPRSSQPLPLR
ncbi:MAG: DUF1152 domain-containing protein [Nannocystaceae bacterium]|nr:DUF1152 domain-containing protein [Myxococcales bacterium]